ncbi:MAG TPA: tetratricopeptide repeat protein, partial [Candidatus Acidoferrum sp.]|nr:tetratricopeptide repeat protein [Candidatus Acidoferrum sp.]
TGQKAFGGSTGGLIIEAILSRTPVPVRTLNPELPVELEAIINKAIEKDKDKRYQSAAEVRADLQVLRRGFESGHTATQLLATAGMQQPSFTSRKKWLIPVVSSGVIATIAAGGWLYYTKKTHALSETDTVVLADFSNKTGDGVFDDTLRQGLTVQLEQSPFLSLIPDQRTRQTLQLMGKPANEKLTPEVAREVCQRLGSKAYLTGSISSLGSQYVIGLSAINCQTGESLTQEQVTADSKEHVLNALGVASGKLREKLGESLKTVNNFSTPIDQATTPSLEALQAYSMGRNTLLGRGDNAAAVPLFKQAIKLDPNLAIAYASLGTVYHNLGEKELAAQNTQRAYELRAKVSERERFYIESHYFDFVTGDLEKSRQVYETWAQMYPREQIPPVNLGVLYQNLGQYEKALAQFRQALKLNPNDVLSYGNLVGVLVNLNRVKEAKTASEEALAKKLDSTDLRTAMYLLAFLQNDDEAMQKTAAWAAERPEDQSLMLYYQSDTAAYRGQLGKARDLTHQCAAAAELANRRERAAGCEGAEALREALFGNGAEAKKFAAAALQHSSARDVQFVAALAFALVGDREKAVETADLLKSRYPEDTIARFNYLPTIYAAIALDDKDAARAVEFLKVASPDELGLAGGTSYSTYMYPVYVRGLAYLDANQPDLAAAQFQKILIWPGVVVNEPIAALAHLQLARARKMNGQMAEAKTSYANFLNLWKNADSSFPLVTAVQAEANR